MEEYQKQSLEKAISYCIEVFSTKEATKRIIDYIIRDRELTEQLRQYNVSGQSEQLVCDCGDSNMTWYGNDDDKKRFCFNCKKEANILKKRLKN